MESLQTLLESKREAGGVMEFTFTLSNPEGIAMVCGCCCGDALGG